jgi:hypothetical protein
MTPPKRKKINLLIPFLLIALFFGGMIWQKYEHSRKLPTVPQIEKPDVEKSAVLFFVADGTRLAREARKIEACTEPDGCVREVLEELFSGAVSELDTAIPEGAFVNDVKVDGFLAIVDVNRNFSEEMVRGSSAEMMAVYSIVNTVCVNFPEIRKVKLNIEGEQNVVLGHLDLSDPLEPDYTLEQAPAQNVPGSAAKPATTGKDQKKKP